MTPRERRDLSLSGAEFWIWRLVLSDRIPGGYNEIAAMPFPALLQAHVYADVIERQADEARRKAEKEQRKNRRR